MSEKYFENNEFDPDSSGVPGKLFGLPFDEEEAKVIVIPVPWEATVSYRSGTASAPEAILEASRQVDLYDSDVPNLWKYGIALSELKENFPDGEAVRQQAEKYIDWCERGHPGGEKDHFENTLREINTASEKLNESVKKKSLEILSKQKIPVVLGGDHSSPLGLMQALAEYHKDFGILQIDAHADLRESYQGFDYSHASIMYNALKVPQVTKLVQVGVRDYCIEEAERIRNSNGRVTAFFDKRIKERQYEGESWKSVCEEIVAELPNKIYISFDIDGMDPKLCPNTGTPVPGGQEFEEIVYLIKTAVNSGKKIIGFDLCEVAPHSSGIDADIGARVLYRLFGLTLLSQNN